MTLQQLKYVSMVEKCGSFSRAAQKLYVSQPSISNLVNELEDELGITIFTRSSTGIAITNEGRELLKLSNRLLRDADYISEYFHSDAEGPKPTFFVSSQHYDFVVSAFEEFVDGLDAERYTLGLNQTQTAAVIEDVRKQYSDLGVIFLSDVNRRHMMKVLEDNNLEFHAVTQAAPHAFLSVTHPLAKRESVTPEELEADPRIETVRYPFLESNPQYDIAKKQMRGGGGMITFDVKGGLEAGKKFINSLKLCTLAVSLGDTETLVEQAAAMTHTMIPKEVREAAGITDGMIRMSVGLEDPDDIIADLDQALGH